MTEVTGSSGYVAIERVNGMLHGRSGAFVLQHTGGIGGQMTITIADSKHFYELEYTLPVVP